MKQADVISLLKKIEKNPDLKRKVKIFLAVGLTGVVLAGGLIIWAGFAAFNYMASSAQQIIQTPAVQSQVESLRTEVTKVPQLQALSCWQKAQSLFAIEPWLAQPLEANLMSLKAACFGAPSEKCEGESCQQTEA